MAITTGISTHLIRGDHLVPPQRGPNGFRLFTEDDIQFFLYLNRNWIMVSPSGIWPKTESTHSGNRCSMSPVISQGKLPHIGMTHRK